MDNDPPREPPILVIAIDRRAAWRWVAGLVVAAGLVAAWVTHGRAAGSAATKGVPSTVAPYIAPNPGAPIGADCQGLAMSDQQMASGYVYCTNGLAPSIAPADLFCAETPPWAVPGGGASCAPLFYYYAHGAALTAPQCAAAVGPAYRCPA